MSSKYVYNNNIERKYTFVWHALVMIIYKTICNTGQFYTVLFDSFLISKPYPKINNIHLLKNHQEERKFIKKSYQSGICAKQVRSCIQRHKADWQTVRTFLSCTCWSRFSLGARFTGPATVSPASGPEEEDRRCKAKIGKSWTSWLCRRPLNPVAFKSYTR